MQVAKANAYKLMFKDMTYVGVASLVEIVSLVGGNIPGGYVVSLMGAISLVEPDGGHIPARCAVPGGSYPWYPW